MPDPCHRLSHVRQRLLEPQTILVVASARCAGHVGLIIDDIDVASLHGRSTVKNYKNEAAVIQTQLQHLGRTDGHVVPCVLEKNHVGHEKGAAGTICYSSSSQSTRAFR